MDLVNQCTYRKAAIDHHSDPFDRLLIAQALTEPLILVTADRTLARYSDIVHVID